MNAVLGYFMVEDQAKALKFYTEVLGFRIGTDTLERNVRRLTVVSSLGGLRCELALNPMQGHLSLWRAYFEDGSPAARFFVADVQSEYERLTKLGVIFRAQPTHNGHTMVATFEDTCGNILKMVQT